MKTLIKWTVSDYHRLIDLSFFENRNVELLAGEIIEMTPEGASHAYLTEGIGSYLRQLLQNRALVREAHPITLLDSEPQPDLAIVKLPRQQYYDRHPFPKDIYWLIEVAKSTLTYDLNEKKTVYATAGIQEYWVIDVSAKQLYRFLEPINQDYLIKEIHFKGIIKPLALSEIEVVVERLWE